MPQKNSNQTAKGQDLDLPQVGEIIIYQSEDGQTRINVKFEDETV
jgi:hypothetical protein